MAIDWKEARGDRWLDAYYYSFDATSSEAVNQVLAAVAAAGKSYHYTADWNDEGSYAEGVSCAELIQQAANDAAARERELVEALAQARKERMEALTALSELRTRHELGLPGYLPGADSEGE